MVTSMTEQVHGAMLETQVEGAFDQRRRRGVRLTVTVLSIVVGAFYLLSFVQILSMK